MKFKIEDLQDLMVENGAPFTVVRQTNESSGRKGERMEVFIFRFEDKLYDFAITVGDGWNWHEIDDEVECREVEAHEVTTVEYRYVK